MGLGSEAWAGWAGMRAPGNLKPAVRGWSRGLGYVGQQEECWLRVKGQGKSGLVADSHSLGEGWCVGVWAGIPKRPMGRRG